VLPPVRGSPALLRWGVTPTSTPTDPPPRICRVLVPTRRFSPRGRFPFRGLFRLGLWRIRPGSPRAYSPLSFASRARFPVSPTMDSTTWGRWGFAAHPNRALRLPAWREVAPGALLSTFQHAHVIHTVGSLLFITEVETGCCPLRCGRTGGAFPEGCNPLQVHSPCHVSVKPAFLATHLRLSRPCREMLLTRHSVVPG
jgi:hypothetical protein